MLLPKLYKRTVKGAIQVWQVEIKGNQYRTHSGQVDGAQVTSEWTTAKPKNVGRSNETTSDEQAIFEADAAYEKKKRDGYSDHINAAQADTTFKCMLAQNYTDALRRKEALLAIEEPGLLSQPKLDGIRCLASRQGLLSRKQREIVAVPHIFAALRVFHERFPDSILDGELYNHDLHDDFDSIVSMVRKGKPTADDLAFSRDNIQYWIYDIGGARGAWKYSDRARFINECLLHVMCDYPELTAPLRALDPDPITEESDIDAFYASYLEDGFEGQMLRINGPYEQKRSPLLLKRKEFEDQEFVVLNVVEGEGNRSGQAGYAVLDLGKGGKHFKAGIKGDEVQRKKLLTDKHEYIGGQVTIRFNGRTPDGVPRFPRTQAWYPGGRTL